MIFTCKVSALSEAVMNVSYAVMAKSNLSALEGILVSATSGKVCLSGYNLELGITTDIPANVSEEGSAVFSSKLFGEIIRKLPDESVKITVDEKLAVSITSGAAAFDIIASSAAEYPELPKVESENGLSIPQSMLKSMIRQTSYAVSNDETRPICMGIKFDIGGGLLKLVSINGVCLAIRTEKIGTDSELSFVVPGKTMNELLKLIEDESEDNVNICVGTRQIAFSVNNYNIYSRLLEGEFIDYNASIPKNQKTDVYISTRKLISCVERASLIISDKVKSPVRCLFEDNLLKISCNTILGKSYDEIEINMSGESVEIGFNNRYLIDTLKAAETDYIRIVLNGSTSPIKVMPSEGDSFLFLILPVRLK